MPKTTKPQNLSRRQREERRQMRRMMLLGGGVFGLAAAAGVGMTLMPPSFPALEGNATIADRLDAEGLSDHVLSLTPSRSTADIVIVGTTDCVACRSFVDDGLEDAVATARDLGLGMIYVPIGSTTTALASTRLTSCFARNSEVGPVETLRAVYGAAERMGRGDSLADVAQRYGRAIGARPREIAACLAQDALEITRRIQAASRAFPVRATPSFLVASAADATRISVIAGWAGAAAFGRQLEGARAA